MMPREISQTGSRKYPKSSNAVCQRLMQSKKIFFVDTVSQDLPLFWQRTHTSYGLCCRCSTMRKGCSQPIRIKKNSFRRSRSEVRLAIITVGIQSAARSGRRSEKLIHGSGALWSSLLENLGNLSLHAALSGHLVSKMSWWLGPRFLNKRTVGIFCHKTKELEVMR